MRPPRAAAAKLTWRGVVISVQPRIRMLRSFDQRSHSYLGYVLRLSGRVGDRDGEFGVAVGEGAHEKHNFRVGDRTSGEGSAPPDPRIELADVYKVAKVEVEHDPGASAAPTPPWHGEPPALLVYRARGHRRLDARTYAAKCSTCIWACRMPVEMIIDHWKPDRREYRSETFCYGPLSCALYKPGPVRKVPGRKGMSWTEEDWVDEQEVAHRGPDE